MSTGLIILIILLILLVLGAPGITHHNFGWGPSGLISILLVVLVVLLILGKIHI